jgi:hypothetical protein
MERVVGAVAANAGWTHVSISRRMLIASCTRGSCVIRYSPVILDSSITTCWKYFSNFRCPGGSDLVTEEQVHTLLANRDGTVVASVSRNSIMLWNVTGHCYALLEVTQKTALPVILENYTGEPRARSLDIGVAALSLCNRFVAGGGERGHIAIWTLRETNENANIRLYAELICKFGPHLQSRIRALAFSPKL